MKRSRKRMTDIVLHEDLLVEELHAVRGELGRIDSKSSMLLGFAGGGLVLAATIQSAGIGGWLVRAGMGIASVSLVPLLAVVRPRIGPTGFPWHARHNPREVDSRLHMRHPDRWRSLQLTILSRLVLRKYRLLRTAVTLQMAGLLVSLAGALLLML
jgi:hypothetical protein